MNIDNSNMKIGVCLATCRRPRHLALTLDGIARQRFVKACAPDLKVIVAENDRSKAGEPVVEAARATMPWPIEYLVEERRGIPFVRNTLVSAAAGCDVIVFIDDDEVAEPQWLDELLAVRESTGADVVLGPVEPIFEEEPPEWFSTLFRHRRFPNEAVVGIREFSTANVLISMKALLEIEGPFDPSFARTGGSDGYLGRVLEARDARFAWADEAIVHETVPGSRSNVSWFLRRRYRNGIGAAMIWSKQHGLAEAVARSLYHTVTAVVHGNLLLLTTPVTGRTGIVEGAGHIASGLGSLLGLAGVRYNEYDTLHGS